VLRAPFPQPIHAPHGSLFGIAAIPSPHSPGSERVCGKDRETAGNLRDPLEFQRQVR
jgi:hypothetical protein